MWMCELTVEWARLCIQYHLDICTSKSVVLTCIIPVEEPSSEEKTKSKERTKALRLTSPCMDQRYKAMWKTRNHGEDQGHERKPTMGVDQVEVHPKEKRSPCRNPRVQVEPDPAWRWSWDEAKVTDLLLNHGDESMEWERSGLGQRRLGPMPCFSSGLTV